MKKVHEVWFLNKDSEALFCFLVNNCVVIIIRVIYAFSIKKNSVQDFGFDRSVCIATTYILYWSDFGGDKWAAIYLHIGRQKNSWSFIYVCLYHIWVILSKLYVQNFFLYPLRQNIWHAFYYFDSIWKILGLCIFKVPLNIAYFLLFTNFSSLSNAI